MRFLILVILFLYSIKVDSCDCTPQRFSVSTIVLSEVFFKGKVTSKRFVKIEGGKIQTCDSEENFSYCMYEYIFKPTEIIKGCDTISQIIVYSDIQPGLCGVGLELGDIYTFGVLKNSKGFYYLTSCMFYINNSRMQNNYLEIIEEYKIQNGAREWKRSDGETVAKGIIVNKMPVGFWRFYKSGMKTFEGSFKNGLKEGTWYYYGKRKTGILQVIYNDGKVINQLYYWNGSI